MLWETPLRALGRVRRRLPFFFNFFLNAYAVHPPTDDDDDARPLRVRAAVDAWSRAPASTFLFNFFFFNVGRLRCTSADDATSAWEAHPFSFFSNFFSSVSPTQHIHPPCHALSRLRLGDVEWVRVRRVDARERRPLRHLCVVVAVGRRRAATKRRALPRLGDAARRERAREKALLWGEERAGSERGVAQFSAPRRRRRLSDAKNERRVPGVREGGRARRGTFADSPVSRRRPSAVVHEIVF